MRRAKSESQTLVAMSAVLFLGAVLMAGCAGPEAGGDAAVTVFEGARLIVGDGSAAIEDAVFVVARLIPVTGPLASKKVGLLPASLWGPLSEVKKIAVWSISPYFSKRATT